MNEWQGAAHYTPMTKTKRQSNQHTFEGDACCLLTDTNVLELIFVGTSLVLFDSTLECDFCCKNEVVEDDFGSPTPKNPNLLETASPTKCPGESPRPPPPSGPGRDRFWREGRECSSLADGRRSEGTTGGLIGRTSWDLRPEIMVRGWCRLDPLYARDGEGPDVCKFGVRVSALDRTGG